MNEERIPTAVGILMGSVLILSIWAIIHIGHTRDCEREHNVFKCEAIYVPVKEDKP